MSRSLLPSTVALVALIICFSDITRASTIHVFLVGGQSNADGRAMAAGLPAELQGPQEAVPFYYVKKTGLTELAPVQAGSATRFGPEITFGQSMADFYAPAGDTVAILKYARGATNLYSDWAANGDKTTVGDGKVYTEFQDVINNGLKALQSANPQATVSIAGMLWVQGEADISDSKSGGPAPSAITDYAVNLGRLIRDIRVTFGEDIPFYFSGISNNQTVFSELTDPDYPRYLDLRVAQTQVVSSVEKATLVEIDGPEFTVKKDNLHFDAAGQQALGKAFAEAVKAKSVSP